jgi:hypothetical protein
MTESQKPSEPQEPNSWPLRVAIDSIPAPEPPTEEQKTKEDRTEGREEKRLWVEVALAFVTIFLLGANVFLVCTARRANKIASDALYISHRPWVGLDGGLQFPEEARFEMYPTNGSIRLPVRYFLKNYGSTPALKETSFALIYITKDDLTRPEAPMRLACVNADSDSKTRGGTGIFPGQPVKEQSNGTSTFDPATRVIFRMWIAVCISYGDDTGKVHHTKTWVRTEPDPAIQRDIDFPGHALRYYPSFEPEIFDEEVD